MILLSNKLKMYRNTYSLIHKSMNFHDIRNIKVLSPYLCSFKRCFCDEKRKDHINDNMKPFLQNKIKDENAEGTVQPGLESKYTVFHDADAPILLDVYEEKLQGETIPEDKVEEFHGLSIERGITGVFDIEDLVQLLRRDKAEDIFVMELPPEARYVDHIVIVTGRSRKHMIALSEIVRRMFKKRRNSTDIIPKIEGESSSMWMAMDLGNIALHIFSRNARGVYDLETLWSVGTEYDSLSQSVEDPLTALLKKHSISLGDVTSQGQLL